MWCHEGFRKILTARGIAAAEARPSIAAAATSVRVNRMMEVESRRIKNREWRKGRCSNAKFYTATTDDRLNHEGRRMINSERWSTAANQEVTMLRVGKAGTVSPESELFHNTTFRLRSQPFPGGRVTETRHANHHCAAKFQRSAWASCQ